MPTPAFYIVSIATIVSLIFYKKFKKTKYIYFNFYLIFVFLIELLGFLFAKIFILKTFVIYNTYVIVTFIFYFIFYRHLFKNKINKIVMKTILFIYLLFLIFDLFILKVPFINNFNVNNMVFGSILLIITLVLFLIEIINNDEIIFNIKKSFVFWISVGTLLFYIGSTPIMISSNYLNYKGLFDNILLCLNIIMYGSFTIGFIYSDTKYNY